jgi:cytochrome c
MKNRSFLLLAALTLSVSSACSAPDLSKLPPAAKKEGVTYEKDIRPIFEASCIRCHGSEKPKAGLRLGTLEGVLKGSKDEVVVKPGHSAESLLVVAVARIDEDSAMPPKGHGGRGGSGGPGHPPGSPGGKTPRPGAVTNSFAGGGKGPMGPPPKPLTPEQVGLVRAWIDQGAK